MITEERLRKLPDWIKRTTRFLTNSKVPAKIVYVIISLFATLWFLFRIIPKPSRALYPCMQVAAPIMSSFVIWILALTGATFAFKKAKHKLFDAKYFAAGLFLILGIGATSVFMVSSAIESRANDLEIWYKPNIPFGVAKGIFPGRVVWGHNPQIASWDGVTGFWWNDELNNQKETPAKNFLQLDK